MRRLSILVAVAALLAGALPTAVGATETEFCRQDLTAGSIKNVQVICRIPTTRHSWDASGNLVRDPATGEPVTTQEQVTAINFLDYGRSSPTQPAGAAPRDVMFVVGRFGLKSFDITNPAEPALLDWLGDGIDDPILADGNALGLLDDFWQNEDMEVDQKRKLVLLSRDPRAYGGNTQTGEAGLYVIDASDPARLALLSYIELPAGHTTTCINDCNWVWTGGPARAATQPPGWAGRPIFVTDLRNPSRPRLYPEPIDLFRNDGLTDYSHDVQVDDQGIAWVSGRGGVRGYWTRGRHFDPLIGLERVATALLPIPYAGGGIDEAAADSRFMHNAAHPTGIEAPDPAFGDLIYATEEDFDVDCEQDGIFVVASLEGSYGGEGWRSTPTDPFRLETIATWQPAGQEGSSTSTDCSAHYFDIDDRLVAYSFYSQGVRLIDISDPTAPIQVGYFRPDGGTSWAPYWHKGLLYTADAHGVYVLAVGVAAGQVSHEIVAPQLAAVLVDDPLADPDAERNRGYICSVPPPR